MKNIESNDLVLSLNEIAAATDQQTVETTLRGLASRYGIKSAAYLGTRITETRRKEPYLAVTYSYDWVSHYKAQHYVDVDPVIQVGFRRLLPLDWDNLGKREEKVKALFGEAAEFGLGRRGLSIPIHGRFGDRSLLSITSDLSEREWAREKLNYIRDFQVLAFHIHDKVLRLEGRQPASANLSPRELECLHWVSEGKTAWECAIILGLSEHTVRCYLESVRHKLKASSNTHAVSIAHRAGLFSPIL